MHWNKWPYWLRGGTIAGVATFLSFLLYLSCSIQTINNSGPESWACLPYLVISPMLPFAMLIDNYPSFFNLFKIDQLQLLSIISIISWFIIGSLIGLFIDYIKSKKVK
jgi:hypothetical protein